MVMNRRSLSSASDLLLIQALAPAPAQKLPSLPPINLVFRDILTPSQRERSRMISTIWNVIDLCHSLNPRKSPSLFCHNVNLRPFSLAVSLELICMRNSIQNTRISMPIPIVISYVTISQKQRDRQVNRFVSGSLNEPYH